MRAPWPLVVIARLSPIPRVGYGYSVARAVARGLFSYGRWRISAERDLYMCARQEAAARPPSCARRVRGYGDIDQVDRSPHDFVDYVGEFQFCGRRHTHTRSWHRPRAGP